MHAPALGIRFHPDVTQDDRDMVAAELLDFETAAVHEISDSEWRVFFRSGEERDRAARVLSASCDVIPIEIDDEDWARRSQQDLKAVRVGDLVVAPPWDTGSRRDPGRSYLIVIEPSTGFGTGHHATTRLCLTALQAIDLRGKRVLDVGTGSGVLAIAAAKLGADSVVAIDNDPDAIAAARENVERNAARVDLRLLDLERAQPPAADVVVANLTGAMLQRSAGRLAALARGGMVIVSGLLDEEEAAVSSAFSSFASSITGDHEGGWAALRMTVRSA